jgi:hypothetical protein
MSELKGKYLKYVYTEGIYWINAEVHELAKDPTSVSSLKTHFLGGNGKNILILTDHDSSDQFPESQRTFLIKILQAIHLSLEDIAIVSQQTNYTKALFLTDFNPKIIIFIETSPSLLDKALNDEKYVIGKHPDYLYLYTDSLAAIENDQEKKKLLWKNLKSLFN